MTKLLINNTANIITIFRLLLTCLFLGNFNSEVQFNYFFVVFLVTFIFILDGVDGFVARFLRQETLFGSFLDIFADRVVEFSFILYLYLNNSIPMWFVVIFYSRILVTDTCRYFAYNEAHVKPSGIDLPGLLHSVVLSPISRTGYGLMKMLLFIVLILSGGGLYFNKTIIDCALVLTILFSLIRGLPIIYTYLPGLINQQISSNKAAFSNNPSALYHSRKGSELVNVQLFQVVIDLVAISLLIIIPILR